MLQPTEVQHLLLHQQIISLCLLKKKYLVQQHMQTQQPNQDCHNLSGIKHRLIELKSWAIADQPTPGGSVLLLAAPPTISVVCTVMGVPLATPRVSLMACPRSAAFNLKSKNRGRMSAFIHVRQRKEKCYVSSFVGTRIIENSIPIRII